MIRLRQAVFVARDLARRSAEVCATLGLEIAHRDPSVRRWGVENVLMPVGTDILEIISPFREGTAAGRFVDRRGDGGYMVILQVDDTTALHRRLTGLGVRAVEFDTASLPNHTFAQFHPSDLGGVLLSVETATPPPGVPAEHFWPPAGPDWAPHIRRETVDALAGVELEVRDPGAAAARWSRALDRAVEPGARGPRIVIDNGDIRFVPVAPGRAPGVRAYDIRVAAPARARLAGQTHEVCGCPINFV